MHKVWVFCVQSFEFRVTSYEMLMMCLVTRNSKLATLNLAKIVNIHYTSHIILPLLLKYHVCSNKTKNIVTRKKKGLALCPKKILFFCMRKMQRKSTAPQSMPRMRGIQKDNQFKTTRQIIYK